MKLLLASILTLLSLQSVAQQPGTNPQAQGAKKPGGMSPTGTFYGKVLDGKTGKPVEFAPIQLFVNKIDTVTKEKKQSLAGGQLSLANGDFSIENVPALGKYTLRIAAMGYQKKEVEVSFNVKPDQMGRQAIVKDLGNIKLLPDSHLIGEVVVDGSDPSFRLEMDKKVYNVDKNPANTGATAQEVLKNVPSVNVDMDGNVTMRNAAPQIFVDGRPTTLTLEQIPADAIENIELITNPSAKYDASSGMGGIINIVMKKNRKMGYHGNVRAGVDMRGRVNGGGDFNMHQGKTNFFVSGNYNQRYSIGTSETVRLGTQSPIVNTFQMNENHSKNYFGFGKIGFDYFMDIRNTITVSASVHKGAMNPQDKLDVATEAIMNGTSLFSAYQRKADFERNFYNINGAIQYKHLFPEAGKELTADVNVSTVEGRNEGVYETVTFDQNGNLYGNTILQKQLGRGGNIFTTAQVDYVDPLSEKLKLESGARASVRNFDSENHNLYYNYGVKDYLESPALTSSYTYLDQIYAVYSTLSYGTGKFSGQAGLRAESSDYSGFLPDSNMSFKVVYPVALFPSGFLSYKLTESSDVQVTYTRKINRPNFFQLMPFTDYSDSLNYRRGSAGLRPEFINSMELSYQKTISKGNSLMFSVYYKSVSNIITGYQVQEYHPVFDENVIINTYANAEYGRSYGAEITSRNNFFKFIDLTLNFNLYNSEINATNVQPDLKNEQLSYFGKANLNLRLPKNFSVQLSGDYNSKTAIPVSGGGGRGGMGGGGGGWMGGPIASVQGYNWRGSEFSGAVKYEFLKNRAASVTLSVSDFLKTEIHRSHTETAFFVQDSERRRDQRFFRLNFMYRFGKMDVNLFRRKNTRQNTDGMEMGI